MHDDGAIDYYRHNIFINLQEELLIYALLLRMYN